jgi:eukaryotic-like serine/threonine-protein kinase
MRGTGLGDFELQDHLGRGGMGVVLGAVHRPTGLPVAIKGITAGAARRDDVLAALRSEIRAVAALDHPAIVAVLDHGIVDSSAAKASGGALGEGSPWLAMELASGGTLRPWAIGERAPFRWLELRALLIRLLDALAHAHARGVLHLDLKPANILLAGENDARPGLKLVDFGLARRIEPDPREVAETDRQETAGTPLYMAPEQFEGALRDFGPWTDLYALGGVAWALATGRPAVVGEDLFAIAFSHLRGDRCSFTPRMAVPDGFFDWLESLMARAPQERFQTAADAAFALALLPDPTSADVPDPGPVFDPGEMGTTLGGLWDSEPTMPPISSAYVPSSGRHLTPPMPSEWRVAERPLPLPQLVGAGLALWGLREHPVVGREEHRDALWAALRQVHARRWARVVLLRGGPGGGKSRLAAWISRRANEVGAAIMLRASHTAAGSAQDGLGPMLARAFGCTGLEPVEARARLSARLPITAPIAAITELVAPSSPPLHRFETPRERWSAVVAAVRVLTLDRPAVLWLDDLHLGLDSTRFATWSGLADLPVLVVATRRDDEVLSPEHLRALEQLEASNTTETLTVGALDPGDGLSLVGQLLGLEPILGRAVAERAGGNPLFAVQLVGDWVERGALEVSPRGFRLRAGVEGGLPESLSAVWQRRLDRLLEDRSPAEAHALELAAALGQRVDASEWAAVCSRCGADPSEDLVRALFAAGLATDAGDREASWSFSHGLLRESVQGRAGPRDAANHRLCAAVLQDRGVGPERLGRHLFASGACREAAVLLLEAATSWRTRSDFPQALSLLGDWLRAQTQAEIPDADPSWLEGLLSLAQVERASGFLERAEQWAERALAGAEARGDEVGAALARVNLGRTALNRSNYEETEALLKRGLEVLEAAQSRSAAADAVRSLAVLDGARARWSDASKGFERARLTYMSLGERNKAALCRVGLAQIERQAKRFDAAAEQLGLAQATFEEIGSRMGRADSANGLGEIARLRGDLRAAERWYRAALTLYEELGSIDVPVATANLGLVLSARGDWARAREKLEDARRSFVLEKRRDLEAATCTALLGPTAAFRDYKAFDEHYDRAIELLERTGFVYSDVAIEAERAGQVASRTGDVERSTKAYRLALSQWTALGRDADAERVAALLQI